MGLLFKARNSKTLPSDLFFAIEKPLAWRKWGGWAINEDPKQIHLIQATASERGSCKIQLPHFLFQYRTSSQGTTKVSPFKALTAKKMNTGILSIPHSQTLILVHSCMTENDTSSKAKMKAYIEQRHLPKLLWCFQVTVFLLSYPGTTNCSCLLIHSHIS